MDNTALTDHSKESGHTFNFEKTAIVAQENQNNKKRKMDCVFLTASSLITALSHLTT